MPSQQAIYRISVLSLPSLCASPYNFPIFLTVQCVSFIYGCKVGWILALVNNFLTEGVSPIEITKDDISWMTSISFTSSIFAVILCYYTAGKVSHRRFLIGVASYYLIAWSVILYTSSVNVILLCFWLYGIASGTQYIISYAYIGEIASPKNREMLGLSYGLATAVGAQVEYLLAIFQSYYLLPILPISASIVALLLSNLMVESPYYLVSQGKNGQALDHLRYLNYRNDEKRALEDLEMVKKYVNERKDIHLKRNLDIILLPTNLKLTVIMIIVCAFSVVHFSCLVSSIGPYVLKDFINYINGNVFVGMTSTLSLIFPFISLYVLKKFNRKTLFIIGYPAAGISQLILALCYYVEAQNGNTVGWLAYVTVAVIMIMKIVIKSTYGPALEILKLEVFPHKMKEFYMSLLLCIDDWTAFFLIKIYFYVEPIAGNAGVLVFCGLISFVSFAIIYFYIEETKGKTLLKIRADINRELQSLL